MYAYQLKVRFMMIAMAQIIPSFMFHSNAWIQRLSSDNGYTEQPWPAKYYAKYLGLGMRYEAGICTIVISMKRTFN